MAIPPKLEGTVPRWAVEDYDGSEKDFSEWLLAATFHNRYGHDVGLMSDEEAEARLMAIARDETFQRTRAVRDVAERAAVWQMIFARRDGWHHLLPSEPDSVVEYLRTMADGDDVSPGELSDLTFMLDTFFPALERHGIEPERIVAIPRQFSKARAAVPVIRGILDTMPEDEAREALVEVLEDIASDMTVRDFKAKLGHPSTYVLDPIEGLVCILPGKTVLLMEISSDIYQRVIEKALHNVVSDWRIADAFEFVRRLTGGR